VAWLPGRPRRRLLHPSLSAVGHRVTAAPSAAEVLKLNNAGVTFDAVLLDIEMSDMTVLEFAFAEMATLLH